MNRQMQFLSVAGLAIAALTLAGAAPAGTQPVEVRARDLSSGAAVVVGTLNKPLGTYMTVEGDFFAGQGKTVPEMHVDAIDNIHRGAAVIIRVDDRYMSKPLAAGRRYRLRGYEIGDFSGTVDDPQNPPTKAETEQRQSIGPYQLRFETVFYVTKAEDLGSIAGGQP